MKEFLLSQNLTKIFDPTQADLTGITNEEIFVSDIIQVRFQHPDLKLIIYKVASG